MAKKKKKSERERVFQYKCSSHHKLDLTVSVKRKKSRCGCMMRSTILVNIFASSSKSGVCMRAALGIAYLWDNARPLSFFRGLTALPSALLRLPSGPSIAAACQALARAGPALTTAD